MLRFIVTLCSHVVMLHYDVIETSSGMCAGAYKRPPAASLGVHSWFIS